MKEAKSYIMSLQLPKAQTCLLKSNRKTGFLGFIVCIESLIGVYENTVSCQQYGLNYLLTYKFSQDHLELFFGKLRRLGGCNNNPTARQFRSAYKRLLVHNDVQDVLRGNTLPLQSVPILTVSSRYFKDDNTDSVSPSAYAINASLGKSKMLEESAQETIACDHGYSYIPHPTHLKKCSHKIVAYIAGFVTAKLKQSLMCETCLDALISNNNDDINSVIRLKSRGALIFPSDDVIEICITCEKCFRMLAYEENLSKVTYYKIIKSVLETYLCKPVFSVLKDHMKEFGPMENHYILLIKAIAEKYIQVRCHYAGKEYTEKLIKRKETKSRQEHNKLILFQGL